ncbi:MAG: response regulator [Lachnospiraceae bacterium]|nr:response regulator [Lachnospiraceae bacterium]
MLKLLIVDDETIFRLGIRSCVDWTALGYVVCGEAQNGKEALEKIHVLKPDVVLLDIKMPLMDGIEVLQELQDKTENIYFVVLSCFNEYDYVRKAMKLGAYDYLFKPVMEATDLQRLMSEIRNRIYSRFGEKESEKPEEQLEIQEILKYALFFDLTEQEREKLYKLNSRLPELSCFSYVLSFRKRKKNVHPDTKLHAVCLAIMNQNLGAEQNFLFQAPEENQLVGLCYDESLGHMHYQHYAVEITRAVSYIREHLEMEVYCGVGAICHGAAEWRSSFLQAQTAQESLFFQKDQSVAYYTKQLEVSYDFQEIYRDIFLEIQNNLLERKVQDTAELLDEINEDILKKRMFNKNDYCHFLATVIISFMRKVRNGEILEQMLLKDYNLISNLYYQENIEEAAKELSRLLQYACQKVYGFTNDETQNQIIYKVKEYVNKNYSCRITLNEVAELVHLNKNYFCKIFKKITGESLVNYITRVRVEHATDLLIHTDKKIYEVAMEVGFLDYHHFCKTYKEYTNMTPSDIKKLNK